MTILKKLYSSIILLFIGGLIIKTRIVFGDGCQGMADFIFFFFLTIIYIITLIIIVAIYTIKYFNKKETFNYFPLLTTLIVIIPIYLSFQLNKYESPTTLYAKTQDSNRRIPCSLTLRKNQTFEIQMREIEWTCYYKGNYKIKDDTLFLLRNDIEIKTDSLFTNKYLMDDNKKLLYPLDGLEYIQDTSSWLKIIDEEK
jgi:heme/copper-type cytochrome/quinol oxidase subunit 2